ncbi:hypothetical protein [Cohnella caldifontis]|uniref:hypothetical protein n=1 Tax=Cohnella caldifontis TaxID=3027471 RepID=UPI0023EB8F9E|nr:hypothetical protein [Cohnella sp. YIM B05605]
MKHATRKWTILLAATVLAAGLTACGKSSEDSQGAVPSASPNPSASASPSASANPSLSPSAAEETAADSSPAPAQGNAAEADLPAAKELSLTLEGNAEKKTANLAEGPGYALYVFDIFSFDSKLGLLTMNVDKNYYAKIEKLPDGYKLDEIKKAAEDKLSKVGDVRELKDAEINPSLGGAALLLFGSNDKLTQEVIVKEVGGTGYRIEVNMPSGEPSEGFGPHLFAMLATLSNLPA